MTLNPRLTGSSGEPLSPQVPVRSLNSSLHAKEPGHGVRKLRIHSHLIAASLGLSGLLQSANAQGDPAVQVSTLAGWLRPAGIEDTSESASFNSPSRVAVDASGVLYVADTSNHSIRKISRAGAVTTLAGSGSPGSSDGTGSSASFSSPRGIAIDSTGNVYVADSENHSIRKISSSGVVTTFAGSGTPGSLDSQGGNAGFDTPLGLAIDSGGILYVADSGNHKIRKISTSGVVSTLAGSGASGSTNGTGNAGSFQVPHDVAVGPDGSVFVADSGNHLIRKITPAGMVTTLAGSGQANDLDGTGTAASFSHPLSIATDASGHVFVGDGISHRIRRISPAGVVSTFAGSGLAGSADATGLSASFNGPLGLVVGPNGNLHVADSNNHKIRQITPAGATTFLAGTGFPGNVDATGIPAGLSSPSGIVMIGSDAFFVDSVGVRKATPNGRVFTIASMAWGFAGIAVGPDEKLYVTSGSSHQVFKVTPSTGTVQLVAGSGSAGNVDGAASSAQFRQPSGIAVDSAGNIFVADSGNHGIRKITPAGVVSTLAAGQGPMVGHFSFPQGIAVASDGNVFVADTNNSRISKITPAGIVSTYASGGYFTPYGLAIAANGTIYFSDGFSNRIRVVPSPGTITNLAGSGSQGSNDGGVTEASFNNPRGLAVDAEGNVHVADSGNHKIRKIGPSGGVTTLAGRDSCVDATGLAARFNNPYGVAVDANGNTYVADTSNHRIRKVTPQGVVSTLAGAGSVGSTNGTGSAAKFQFPMGVAVDPHGNVFVADTRNYRIRKIDSGGVVTTLAGTGSIGNADGASATFRFPEALAVDTAGNVYVADGGSHQIRKIAPNGFVTTLAGSGSSGSLDGVGTSAGFSSPKGVAVDSAGNVYVADSANHKIRKISPAGQVTTLAGSGLLGSTDGAGISAEFRSPTAVAVAPNGNVYVGDGSNYRIRKILPGGMVSTLAGSISGNTDGPGDTAKFVSHIGLAVGPDGNLSVADHDSCRIRRVVIPKLSQSISFNGLVDRVLGGPSFDLVATATSGLPVAFSVKSGPATLSGGKLAVTGTGTVTILASQAGNATYDPAPVMERSFNAVTALAVFNTWAGGAGLSEEQAAVDAVPFNDGVPNLLKYAFNMNAGGPDVSVLTPGGTSGLPQIAVDRNGAEPVLCVEFLRRKGSGLIYTPQRSDTLDGFVPMTGKITVTSIDAQWERVSIEETVPPNPAPNGFARIQVSLP